MSSDSLATAVANDPSLDERRRDIFRRAFTIAFKEQHLVRRESGNDGSRTVFDRNRGEMRIVLDMTRHREGDVAEALDLKVIEMECTVFHIAGQRVRFDRGRTHVTVTIFRDTSSYWEVILRHVPL